MESISISISSFNFIFIYILCVCACAIISVQAEEEALLLQQYMSSENPREFDGRVRSYISQVRMEVARKFVPVEEFEEKALPDKYFPGRELQAIKNRTRSCFHAAAAFLVQKILQARKNLVAIFHPVVDKRINERKEKFPGKKAKDMMNALIDVEDENGKKLSVDDITDILLMYLNAGHESTGHMTMKRPPTQKGLSLAEVRKMEYLSKELHKAREFLPFGAGSRMSPGNDLAKLEISVFLHHFLLNYEFINLKEFQLKWIRQKIGLVSQEPVLFTCIIKVNIAYGKDDATVEEITYKGSCLCQKQVFSF
ncbi:hypothetical protein V8G54_030644 [Vigna mungo]|uniref:Uncharacterized protein n=1 Tax=Vigna mungo TaxID=3915 RepID=A0AAQ3RKA1_VIGMU